jgi:PAS domain S-box-containing protein
MPPLEKPLSPVQLDPALKEQVPTRQDIHSIERALRESQDKFAQAFHGSIDAVAIADFPSGAMTEINDAYCRLFGYSREETIGHSGNDLGVWAEAGDRAKFIEVLARDGTVWEMEAVKLTKAGKRLICRITSSRMKLGDRAVIVTRIRDISEQRMAEAAMRESEEKFSKAFRAVPDAIGITTLEEGRFVDINAAYTRTFGWTREETIGRTTTDLNIWLKPGDRLPVVERLRAGETVHDQPMAFRDKRGALHSCLYFGEITEIAGQKCLISIVRDITHQQHLEEQLRHAQKMESIGLLAGGVAHDFNNILTVIQGNISLALDGALPPGLGDMLRQVQDATAFAATLTRQLLVFSRRQVLQPGRVSLGDAIQRVVKLLRRTLGEHIVLRVETDPSVSDATADVGMVEQVLLNLAVNARDAMPKGGSLVISTLKLEADADYVRRVPQAKLGRFVGFRVKDTGMGIPPDVLLRIFDPFFTTKADGQGTGLGLATVYTIAQQHGGWIEVDSEVGRGSQFVVWFPPEPDGPAVAVARPPSPVVGTGSEALLLVEDKDEVRAVLQSVFARNGYRIFLAANGPDAIKIWEEHRDEISLLFTDVVMPGGMNGRELAERLRLDRPALKVIYCSGYDANILGPDALAKPGTGFLAKPFNLAQAVSQVRGLLDQT